MIVDENLSDLVKSGRGRYLLVNVVRMRSRELFAGAKPLVKTPEGTDPGTIAFMEMTEGHLKVLPRKKPRKLVDIADQAE